MLETKLWYVELKRTSYITLSIQADSKEEAERKAWEEINNRPHSDDASWEVESIQGE